MANEVYNIWVTLSTNKGYGVLTIQATDDIGLITLFAKGDDLNKPVRYIKYYGKEYGPKDFATFRDFAQWVSDKMQNDIRHIEAVCEQRLSNISKEVKQNENEPHTKPQDVKLEYLHRQERECKRLKSENARYNSNADVNKDQMDIMDFLGGWS